jgi:hypothetical protein
MRVFPLFLITVAVGCGRDDDPATLDAPPIDAANIDASICEISSRAFGDLGERAGTATMEGNDGNGLATVYVPLTDGPLPDMLYFFTWGGVEDHPEPIAGGTFQLTGINTNPRSCDVCVGAYPDWTGTIDVSRMYFATTGTAVVTLDPNPNGVVELELTNLRLNHIRIVNDQPVLHPDGCDTTVDRISFRGTFADDGSS